MRIGFFCLMLFFSALSIGCSSKPPELEGAINKDKIPVYSPSEKDTSQAFDGATLEGEDGVFYSKLWELKSADPPEKIVAFYKQALPQAKEEKMDDNSGTVLTWSEFPGAEKGEYIQIGIKKDGTFSIHECLKAGKHKKN